MNLLDKDIQPLFWTPSRLDKDSAWWGHVAFAHWITSVCKPKVLVELGTENGVSYSAFCDAILYSKIKAAIFAVDTWEGDNQTGSYGDDVYSDLDNYNNERYSDFSKLLRMTFNKARDLFNNDTVDILHIDGYHTYDAVKWDFDSWLPKLSDRGIVLLHDTNVRHKEDYGVWKFFEELSRKYPCFNFLHSYGLGVVVVGYDIPEPIRELCFLNEDDTEKVRNIFAHLGAIWIGVNRSYRSLALLHADNSTPPH